MSVPVAFLNQLSIRKHAAFSGISLLVYDYMMTFPLEVKYIWNAPWTAIKVGFLINRYGCLVGQTFVVLEEMGYFSHDSSKFCTTFWGFCPFYMILSAELMRILVLLRARAIWRCMHRVIIFTIGLYTFYGLVVMAVLANLLAHNKSVSFLYVDQVHVCVMPVPPFSWLAWFATIGLDTIALVMIWHGLRKLWKESRGIYPSQLIHLLIRDAIIFYATSMFNTLFSIICWTAFRDDPRNFLLIVFSFPLVSVVGQRLVLNLREFRPLRLSTRGISHEIDRQMADMSNRLWFDLGVETEPLNPASGTDMELQPAEGELDLHFA